ncbi:TetR/AcrR family transcriptional regulator [Occallatibacter riparius]|uniref:TetR/AcrR family transcriptional regulator n=1 Tax=Occallatibacter riparius TaxID=1002689 RepID=A0A9J7BSS5_9BACT|nr:TetR/AcrR family transcriptional regulator [Occallatibacter riparius]UWZ83958.1 TetR/AcrR family transcriptional regulator [Occallatibacter riparius]
MDEKTATSRRIYDCALRILEAEGPQAVSMRRVAKDAGITAMAIYHHFPSREALLDAVVQSEFEQLAVFFSRPNAKRSLESAMTHILDGYIDYALAHPRIFDYVFASPREGARRFPDDFRARQSPTLNLVYDVVSSWMKLGKLKRDDAWEISMELWAQVHGYLALWQGGRFHLPEDQFRKLVHRSLRRLLYGLAS